LTKQKSFFSISLRLFIRAAFLSVLTSQRSGKNHNQGLGTELLITIIGDNARGTKNIELASGQLQ
jgi:hypothetical protein